MRLISSAVSEALEGIREVRSWVLTIYIPTNTDSAVYMRSTWLGEATRRRKRWPRSTVIRRVEVRSVISGATRLRSTSALKR